MKAMSETISPQGILAICKIPNPQLETLKLSGKSILLYLHEIQDPGNAGTILRSADALGASAVITSPGSVDMYSPKVGRSTAGSLWHLPVFERVSLDLLQTAIPKLNFATLSADGKKSIRQFRAFFHEGSPGNRESSTKKKKKYFIFRSSDAFSIFRLALSMAAFFRLD
jgi:TrmH family RNA methyltransferase